MVHLSDSFFLQTFTLDDWAVVCHSIRERPIIEWLAKQMGVFFPQQLWEHFHLMENGIPKGITGY